MILHSKLPLRICEFASASLSGSSSMDWMRVGRYKDSQRINMYTHETHFRQGYGMVVQGMDKETRLLRQSFLDRAAQVLTVPSFVVT